LDNNLLFFFFSSRRRHTRWPRDWSSDVCSSDLRLDTEMRTVLEEFRRGGKKLFLLTNSDWAYADALLRHLLERGRGAPSHWSGKIGRASCRERGESAGGGVAVKKKGVSNRRRRR